MRRGGVAMGVLWTMATVAVSGASGPAVWTVGAMTDAIPTDLEQYIHEHQELVAERHRLYKHIEMLHLQLDLAKLQVTNRALRTQLEEILGEDHPTLVYEAPTPTAAPSAAVDVERSCHANGAAPCPLHEAAAVNTSTSRSGTALTINCATVKYTRAQQCGVGERRASPIEVTACLESLCVDFPPWGIANGDGVAILGREYQVNTGSSLTCNVHLGEHSDGGEVICASSAAASTTAHTPVDPPPNETNPAEPTTATARRAKIKGMFRHAWSGYERHAWGENELAPISQHGVSGGIFGTKMGSSIVDALDTLVIMGLTEELERARQWVATEFKVDIDEKVSVFETTIRFIGGFLSAYALTADPLFRTKAVELADRLLPAFDTPTGVPTATVNLATAEKANWGWASHRAAILSEFGSLQLEFTYLSDVTGNPTYRDAAEGALTRVLESTGRPTDGTFPTFFDTNTGNWPGPASVSLGAYGDSFYEYLLKTAIYSGDEKRRRVYDTTIQATSARLHRRAGDASGLLYIADERNGNIETGVMYHLTCFTGGLYALSGITTTNATLAAKYATDARDVTQTCHQSYSAQAMGLGPEAMRVQGGTVAADTKDARYQLRPETVESYFYMWRTTHDPKYREWAWDAALAIEKHCKCSVGYCGVQNVNQGAGGHDDVQQSFFLAETLKYLYLIFADDDEFDLSKWVFNTEAHPFPINNTRLMRS